MDPFEPLPYSPPSQVSTASPVFVVSLFGVYLVYIAVMMNCLRQQQRLPLFQQSIRH